MDCSMPGLLVLHYLLEFGQTHVRWVGDAIQPSHSLLSPSPPALSLSQHQGLFQLSQLFTSGGPSIGALASVSVLPMSQFFAWDDQSIGVSASVSILSMFIQDWFLRIDGLDLHAVQGTLKSLLQHHSSKESILHHSAVIIAQLSHLYMTTRLPWWLRR